MANVWIVNWAAASLPPTLAYNIHHNQDHHKSFGSLLYCCNHTRARWRITAASVKVSFSSYHRLAIFGKGRKSRRKIRLSAALSRTKSNHIMCWLTIVFHFYHVWDRGKSPMKGVINWNKKKLFCCFFSHRIYISLVLQFPGIVHIIIRSHTRKEQQSAEEKGQKIFHHIQLSFSLSPSCLFKALPFSISNIHSEEPYFSRAHPDGVLIQLSSN